MYIHIYHITNFFNDDKKQNTRTGVATILSACFTGGLRPSHLINVKDYGAHSGLHSQP